MNKKGAKQLKILIMYRIIEVTTCNEVVYRVQKKFLWLWFTKTLPDIGITGTYDVAFELVEEAEEYIRKACFKPKIKVIKTFNKTK